MRRLFLLFFVFVGVLAVPRFKTKSSDSGLKLWEENDVLPPSCKTVLESVFTSPLQCDYLDGEAMTKCEEMVKKVGSVLKSKSEQLKVKAEHKAGLLADLFLKMLTAVGKNLKQLGKDRSPDVSATVFAVRAFYSFLPGAIETYLDHQAGDLFDLNMFLTRMKAVREFKKVRESQTLRYTSPAREFDIPIGCNRDNLVPFAGWLWSLGDDMLDNFSVKKHKIEKCLTTRAKFQIFALSHTLYLFARAQSKAVHKKQEKCQECECYPPKLNDLSGYDSVFCCLDEWDIKGTRYYCQDLVLRSMQRALQEMFLENTHCHGLVGAHHLTMRPLPKAPGKFRKNPGPKKSEEK